ncbi:hypothetical protein WDU94_010275 [Cyamophila willieti]
MTVSNCQIPDDVSNCQIPDDVSNCQIPDDVLEDILSEKVLSEILSHVDVLTLLHCRRVCKQWNRLIDTQVMRTKAKREGFTRGMDTNTQMSLTWCTWYHIMIPNSPFMSNFVRNPCGQYNFGGWEVISSPRKDGWTVDWKRPKLPTFVYHTMIGFDGEYGSRPHEMQMKNYWRSEVETNERCFATSYERCIKRQLIDLRQTDKLEYILDEFKPTIVYRDWYCRHSNVAWGGGKYVLKVCLLDNNAQPLAFHVHSTWMTDDPEWQKVENKFEDYPPGVRYVLFYHEGFIEKNGTPCYYGPKMTQSTVFFVTPGIDYEINMEGNLPLYTREAPVMIDTMRKLTMCHDNVSQQIPKVTWFVDG